MSQLQRLYKALAREGDDPVKFRADLICGIERLEYDFRTRTARMYLPELHCCDMTGAIAMMRKIDPRVQRIETYAGQEPDTLFLFTKNKWEASCRRPLGRAE